MTKAGAFGVPRRALLGAAVFAIAGAVPFAPAAARDFCAGLRQAMAHAAGDFESLKIAGERVRPGAVAARTLLPGGNRCEVQEGPYTLEYRCRMTPLDASSAATRASFRRDVGRMRRCFAGLLPRGDGDYTARTEWTGAVIWQPRPGLRAAVVFYAGDEIALAASRREGEREIENVVWVVVEKRKR